MSVSTIEIKDETCWMDVPQTPPPVVRAQLVAPDAPARVRRDPLKPLDINALDEILVAWSDRSYQNRMAVLNAEADNLLWDILGAGKKEAVMDALTDIIATAKGVTELKVPLWSYKTVEYDYDAEGTSWADKPYDGFDTSREWAHHYGYETHVSASRYSVEYLFKHTDAMKRLEAAFADDYFRVVKHKVLDCEDEAARAYTVYLTLEFWPSKTLEARLHEAQYVAGVVTEPVFNWTDEYADHGYDDGDDCNGSCCNYEY
jgi:hypothetical protein